MSQGLTVVGEVRSSCRLEAGGEGERLALGAAVQTAVAASRLGLDVRLLAAAAEEGDAELRAPLAAEGVDVTFLAPVDLSAEAVPEPWEQALRRLRRRDALLCTLDVPGLLVARALEEAHAVGGTAAAVAVERGGVSPRWLAHGDLLVGAAPAARVLLGDEAAEEGPRGLARRLAAFGLRRVVVVDPRGGGSILFDGTQLRAVPLGGAPRPPAHLPVLAAGLVAAFAAGERVPRAVARAARCAQLEASGQGAFADLPGRVELEAAFEPA